MGLLNKVIQHALGHFEVGNHTILHGTDCGDVARRSAEHFLGLFADRFHLPIVLVDRNDRRFIDYDALTAGKDESIGCPQVDRKI